MEPTEQIVVAFQPSEHDERLLPVFGHGLFLDLDQFPARNRTMKGRASCSLN
jgi:hypothetical protein